MIKISIEADKDELIILLNLLKKINNEINISKSKINIGNDNKIIIKKDENQNNL